MSVLLITEHNNKELKSFTLNAVTAASQIDSDVHALVIGNNCADAAKAASEIPLVKKVLKVEAPYYANFIAENFAMFHPHVSGLPYSSSSGALTKTTKLTKSCAKV